MSEPWLLSKLQMRRTEPYFPLSHGSARVVDRCIVSGIIYGIRGRLDMAGRAQGVCALKDDLQPLHPLKPTGGRLQPHLR